MSAGRPGSTDAPLSADRDSGAGSRTGWPDGSPRPAQPVIHFVGGGRESVSAICRMLKFQGCRTRVIASEVGYASILAASKAEQSPHLIVVDQDVFDSDTPLTAHGIGGPGSPAFIVASDRDDLESRLAAFRAGACSYFLKPLSAAALSSLAESIAVQASSPPIRVLLVDDMRSVLALHAEMLRASGMVVETLNDPLRLLETLDEFRPDVLVLDVFMPQAEGPELAAVVRDRDRHRNLPILFLSSETDPVQQIRALAHGGDDFLVKPVDHAHFAAAVATRAQRSRRTNNVAARLRAVQYERGREHLALDRHALVSVTDRAGTIIHANDKFCEVSGFTRNELIGQNHRIVKSDFHPPEFYRELWCTIRKGDVWTGEIQNRRKDGTPYWVESTIVPFSDDSGGPYQYISIRTEITQLKQAEERLRVSQSHANIGTWDWNVNSGELLWSERVGPLFGLPDTVRETTSEAFFGMVHPEDQRRVVKAIDECLCGGAPYRVEHRCLWPDGTVRWLLEAGDVVRDSDGRPTNMLGVVQDITDLKRAEEALVSARDEAEAANRAKSDFLSAMSHELRTPLNAILGFAQVLELDEGLNDDQRDSARTIRRSGKHLLRLINEILNLARIESGRMELSIEDVELEEVISGCGKFIAPLAAEAGLAVQFQRDVDIVAIRADATRLQQVLLNLLGNAVKYNRPGGSITVTASRSDQGRARIAVTDTGQGIPAHKLAKLFTAFSRLGAEHSTVEGTGIGLVIAKRLVEAMGGEIGVNSILGSGSTFWFELPAAIPSDGPVDAAKTAASPMQVLPAGTVLYVEDNAANLKLVRQALAPYPQVELLGADNSLTGLDIAQARKPDVILLDINMPGLDGMEVLARLQSNPATRAIPTVAVSAGAMDEDIRRALAAGFRHYLTKPIDIVDLLQLITRLLRQPDRRRVGERRKASNRLPAAANRQGELQ